MLASMNHNFQYFNSAVLTHLNLVEENPVQKEAVLISSNPAAAATEAILKATMSSLSSPAASGVEYPGGNDVMLGRGGESNHHIGNANFRKHTESFKNRYKKALKQEKPRIAREVVMAWRNQSPPGRFLSRRDPKVSDSPWYDVGDSMALKRTTKTLGERPQKERRAEKAIKIKGVSKASKAVAPPQGPSSNDQQETTADVLANSALSGAAHCFHSSAALESCRTDRVLSSQLENHSRLGGSAVLNRATNSTITSALLRGLLSRTGSAASDMPALKAADDLVVVLAATPASGPTPPPQTTSQNPVEADGSDLDIAMSDVEDNLPTAADLMSSMFDDDFFGL